MNERHDSAKTALYWRFVADIRGPGTCRLRWGYVSPRKGGRLGKLGSGYEVAMLDNDGVVLLTHPVEEVKHFDSAGKTSIAGAVPFHPATARIILARRNVTILTVEVPHRRPILTIVRQKIDPTGNGEIEWKSEGGSEQEMLASVYFQDDKGRRYPLVNHARASGFGIRMDELPGCQQGRFVVVASDGVWSVEEATEPFVLPPKMPIVLMQWPLDDAKVRERQPLQALAQAWDVQAQRPLTGPALEWFLDGMRVGEGRVCVIRRVEPGRHSLVLRATDSTGQRLSQETMFTAVPVMP